MNEWERLPDETGLWFQRFEKFRLLGPDRSVLAAYNAWRAASGRDASRNSPLTWRNAAKRFRWYERADAWDAHLTEQAAQQAEAERLEIYRTGYALRHERVRKLNALAELLFSEVDDESKRWLDDVKSIGRGDFAHEVDIVRFNAPLIEQARKTLDDLAKELGDRVQRQEHSGQIAVPMAGVVDVSALDDEQLSGSLGALGRRLVALSAGTGIPPGRDDTAESDPAGEDTGESDT